MDTPIDQLMEHGIEHAEAGRHAQAIACFKQVLQADPQNCFAHHNLAVVYQRDMKLDAALPHARLALDGHPCYGEAWNTYGAILYNMGWLTEALQAYDRAAECDPGNLTIYRNQTITHLLRGDWRRGWAGMPWQRLPIYPGFKEAIRLPLPNWDGSDLNGHGLVVHNLYAGNGDLFHFIRFAGMVKERYPKSRIYLICQPHSVRFLKSCRFLDHVCTHGDTLAGPIDWQVNLEDLPLRLELFEESQLVGQAPYLRADPGRLVKWRQRLEPKPGQVPRVALCWRGASICPANKKSSIDEALFLSLTTVPGLQFYAFQKDARPEEIPPGVVNLGPELEDYADTAAALSFMDLTVSVDTSLVHVAGAMGLPVWIPLRKFADWRWLLDREDTIWYPSVRLFRQKVLGEWPEVFERIRSALQAFQPQKS